MDASQFTAKERKQSRKNLLKKIDQYNKQAKKARRPSFPITNPSKVGPTSVHGYCLELAAVIFCSAISYNLKTLLLICLLKKHVGAAVTSLSPQIAKRFKGKYCKVANAKQLYSIYISYNLLQTSSDPVIVSPLGLQALLV